MSTANETIWNKALNSCDLQHERHREIVFENLNTNKPKKVSLVFRDNSNDGVYKIPLGKVNPKAHNTGSVKDNIIVPVIPLLYTTTDKDKFEAIPVRKGWIYVFLNSKLWRELEVVDRSYMRDVNLTIYQSKDRRPATCELDTRLALPFKIDGKEQTVEIAFSEVQWSWDYINTFGGMDATDSRVKSTTRMASANNEVYAKGVREIRLTKINNLGDYSSLFSASSNDSDVGSIHKIQDRFHKKIHMPSEMGAIFIEDPIGTSRVLALKHENAWAELTDLVESLRTGNRPDPNKTIFSNIENAGNVQSIERKEIAAQYDVLALMYRIAYGSKDGKEKMGGHMNEKMFTQLLAVEERKKIRKKIENFRKDLTDYLNTDKYQRALSDFINNTPERVIEGKGWVALSLRMLASPIHALDAHLELPDTISYNKNDPGIKYVQDTMGSMNYAGALLRVPAKITVTDLSKIPSGYSDEEILGLMGETAAPITTKLLGALDNKAMDITTKVTAIVTALVDGFASQTIKEKAALRQLVQVINTIQIPGFPEFKISSQVYSNIKLPDTFEVVSQHKFKLTHSAPVKLVYPTSKYYAYASGDYGVIVKGRTIQVVPAIVSSHEIYVDQIVQYDVPSKTLQSDIARNIRSSKLYVRGFGSFLAILEIINIKSAITQTSEAAKNGSYLKSNINWVGTVFGTGATLAYVTELYAKNISKKALEMSMASAGKWLGKIAAVPAAFLTAWEAATNFEEGDTDAGIAYSVAALATFGVLFATPVGAAVLVGIALGALIFAWFLEDDPLERFSKNGPLRADKKIPDGGNVWEKIKKSAQTTGVNKKYKRWQTWQEVRTEMFDYFQAFETKIRINREMKSIKADLNRDGNVTIGERLSAAWINSQITSLVAKTVDVTIIPREFYVFTSDLDYYCRYYKKGVGKGEGVELLLLDTKPEVDIKTGKVKKINYSFGLPANVNPEDDEHAEIMFCSRMRTNKSVSNFVPVETDSGEARFIAVKRKANSVQSNQAPGFVDDNPDWAMGRGVDTLKTLETVEHWKNK